MSPDTPNERPTNPDAAPDSLEDLARQIRRHHTKCQNSLRSSLGPAREAGDALKKAKGIIKDGGGSWGRWCRVNCELSSRQAQKYMQLAERFDELVRQGHDPAKLTINQALTLLASLRGGERSSAAGPAAPAGAGKPQTPYRVSRGELRARERETQRLVATEQIRFAADTPEGKFVLEKVKALVEQIRRQAARPRAGRAEGDPVLPIHLAIALVERLSQALHAGVVVEVEEARAEAPAPEAAPGVAPAAPPPDPGEPPSPPAVLTPAPAEAALPAEPAAHKAAVRPASGNPRRNGTPVLV